MPITSLTITRKEANIWVFSDNETPEGEYNISNAYSDRVHGDRITLITKSGGIIYNLIPYWVIEYVDEVDPENTFTPTSALQLHTYLDSVNFFGSSSGEGGATAYIELSDTPSSYYGNEGKFARAKQDGTGMEFYDIGDADQDNIDITKYFKYTAADTQEDILAHINGISDPTILLGGPYIVNAKQSVWFVGTQVGAFPPKVIKYKMKNAGKGTYGNIGNISGTEGTALSLSNLELVYSGSGTITDVENDPSTVIQDYGDIEGQTISEWLNELVIPIDIQSQEDGYTLFQGTVDGVAINYLWIGDAGTYGDGEAQSTMADFLLIEDVAPEPAIPTLQSVTDAGNSTSNHITITGTTGKTDYFNNGHKYTDTEGNTVTVEHETPVVPETKLFVPALPNNDWFATRGTVSPRYKFQYPMDYIFRPCGIYYLDGKWHTDLLIKYIVEEKISKLRPYYVDGNIGSNSNNGLTEATPFQTLDYAFSQGAKLVYILPGIHENIMGNLNNASYGSDDKFIIAKDPNNTYLLHSTSGIEFSAYEDIYSADVSGSTSSQRTNAVIDFKFVNEFNLPYRLEKMSTLGEAEATEGSYFLDEDNFILYVHTLDSREPDSDIYCLTRYQSNQFRRVSDEYVYVEGITFMGGGDGFILSNNGNGLMVNNRYIYSEGNGFRVTTTGGFVWSDRCISFDNGRDGFNYTQADGTTTQRIIETNCQAFLNGHHSDTSLGDTNLNGSSLHDNVTGLRIGCKYWGNVGPNVADVAGSRSLNIGVDCFQSEGFETFPSPYYGTWGDFVAGSGDPENPTYVWLYGCKSKDTVRSFYCAVENAIGTDNSRIFVDESLHIAPYGGNVVFGAFEVGDVEKTELPPLSAYTEYIAPIVRTVTGTAVDDTDPENPIIDIPSGGIRSLHCETADSATVTGTTTETIVGTALIPAGISPGIINLEARIAKSTNLGLVTTKIYLNAVQIGIYTTTANNNRLWKPRRTFNLKGATLTGHNFSNDVLSDDAVSASLISSTAINTAIDNTIEIRVTLANTGDSVLCDYFDVRYNKQ